MFSKSMTKTKLEIQKVGNHFFFLKTAMSGAQNAEN